MLPKYLPFPDAALSTGAGSTGKPGHPASVACVEASLARAHWLCVELVMHSTAVVGSSPLSPSVVDVEGELGFWRKHYQRTAAWHRDILPFNEYVPAFTLGISLFLQCHDCLLEALDEQRLAPRYARLRRNSRVEWHEARQAVHAGYLRLQRHGDDGLDSRPETAEAPPPLARPPSLRIGAPRAMRRGRHRTAE